MKCLAASQYVFALGVDWKHFSIGRKAMQNDTCWDGTVAVRASNHNNEHSDIPKLSKHSGVMFSTSSWVIIRASNRDIKISCWLPPSTKCCDYHIKVNWQAMQCHHIASFIPRLSHSKEGDNLVHFIMYNVKGNVRRRESLGQDIRTLG